MNISSANRSSAAIELDFSENVNPLGIPSGLRSILTGNVWEASADTDINELVRKLSRAEHIPEENIVCGNGTGDLINRIISVLRPEKALICAPTFGGYKNSLLINGCSVTELQLSPDNSFAVTSDIAESITENTDIFFLCSPNDPAGEVITPYTMSIIAEKCSISGTTLVCDESLMGFVERSSRFSLKSNIKENMIVLSSYSELYGFSGLPVACGFFGDARTAGKVRELGAYSVFSRAGLKAVSAALEDPSFLLKTKKCIEEERLFLSQSLTAMGLMVYPSKANFLLFRCEPDIDELLAKRGIIIRNCAGYTGLDSTYYRIAVRSHEDNARLISEIARLLCR